ncbi:ParA family protein [Caproiciproducens galactitolivorans]|uniref:ParA family protein n=1 Tax=Caproiciproducens galactitolivorans TaxID=642589 RepID=UPI0024099D32|nr:ParA family protein [Caproiciproducens galactitolivorans]
MKTISIINLKGGVAKTISAINIAYALAVIHGKNVLLVDNDKQGNTSKFFNVHSYDAPSLADVLTVKDFTIAQAVQHTEYKGLDVLPANMYLLRANKEILLDVSRPQQTRLSKALRAVAGDYDYVVIDNAPDLNMSVINGLVACDDVLIPIKIDKFAFDGLEQLREQIEETREFNERIKIAGCFITMYQRNNVNLQGEQYLNSCMGLPLFKTVIHKTVKVDETTFAGKPLQAYSRNCTAAKDYAALVEEYLNGAKS